jgi:hypothetical protein
MARVRRALDFRLENRDFLLWFIVEVTGDVGLDEDALRRDVDGWLGRLDVEDVLRRHDEPEQTWVRDGLVVRFTAVPKLLEGRLPGLPIVGNPIATAAYRSGIVSGETGFPTVHPADRRR